MQTSTPPQWVTKIGNKVSNFLFPDIRETFIRIDKTIDLIMGDLQEMKKTFASIDDLDQPRA